MKRAELPPCAHAVSPLAAFSSLSRGDADDKLDAFPAASAPPRLASSVLPIGSAKQLLQRAGGAPVAARPAEEWYSDNERERWP